MKVEWGGGGKVIVSYSTVGQGMTQKGETKYGKEDEEDEALLNMSNRMVVMEEAMAKAIAKAEEQLRVDKDSSERRMEVERREIVSKEKSRAGMVVEKQPL